MTIKHLLSWLETKGYTNIDQREVVGWIYRVDAELWRDVIRTREGGEAVPMPEPYDPDHPDTVLLLGAPDDDAYTAYVEYKICLEHEEAERAADAAALYNARIDNWTRYYFRTHRGRRVPLRY